MSRALFTLLVGAGLMSAGGALAQPSAAAVAAQAQIQNRVNQSLARSQAPISQVQRSIETTRQQTYR